MAGRTPLGKVGQDLFVRNGRDLAADDVIDAGANLIGPRFIDRRLVGDLK